MATVIEAVVQAVGAALPELHALGLQARAAPLCRARRVLAGKALGDVAQAPFQFGAMGQGLALRRRPGAHLAGQRPRMEVVVGQLRRQALSLSGDNWASAARMLGLDSSNLHKLARRLGLK